MKTFAILTVAAMSMLNSAAYAIDTTIMSFNIRFGTANDGDDAWEHRRDLVVETIRNAAPDVVGLQECLDFQVRYLVEKLPEYAWFGLGREADGTGEMTAVIYRSDRLLPVETSHHWLSETPAIPGSKSWDSSLTRIVSRATFFHTGEKRPFVFYNTHFDHRGEEARQESARLLVKLMKKESLPVVLTGDFNALGGNSKPWGILMEGGFLDAWDVAKEQQGPANTWNGFEKPADDASKRIDWIVTSPGVEVSVCTTLDHQKDGHYPSDHFPVVAVLHLPEGPEGR